MDSRPTDPAVQSLLQEMLGYLNFSSGTPDVRFRQNMNELMHRVGSELPGDHPWETFRDLLSQKLRELAGTSDTFRETEQAQTIIELAFDRLPKAYRKFHHDLLHHQTEADLFQPFFLVRCCEVLLRQGSPWNDVDKAVGTLNDFLGYRPVAVLHTPQKIEPYSHEWVCPQPLYFRARGSCMAATTI